MIFRSKYPDVATVDRPVHEWVLGDASRHGTRPAMVDVSSGRMVTYAELVALVRGLAAGLAAEGIGKGDVVALHSPNTVLFPVVLYATTTAGGTVTTLSPLARPARSPSSSRYGPTSSAARPCGRSPPPEGRPKP